MCFIKMYRNIHQNEEGKVLFSSMMTNFITCICRNRPTDVVVSSGPGPHCGRCSKTVYDMEKAVGMTDVSLSVEIAPFHITCVCVCACACACVCVCVC